MDYNREKKLKIYNPMDLRIENNANVPKKPKSRKQMIFEAYSHDINRPLVPEDAAFSFRAIPVPNDIDPNMNRNITNMSPSLPTMGIKNLDVSSNVYRATNSGYDYDYRIPYDAEGGRSKSPNILVDLVISTPQNELKINRKCKNYEIGIFT
jgi:hypothetical protein